VIGQVREGRWRDASRVSWPALIALVNVPNLCVSRRQFAEGMPFALRSWQGSAAFQRVIHQLTTESMPRRFAGWGAGLLRQ